MVSIFAVQVNGNLEDKDINRLMNLVSKEKAEWLKQFKYKIDLIRSLVGDVLVRFLICRKLNISNEQICFETNKYGKMKLEGNVNLHFNISHSGEWVVCAIGNSENGIDVEKIQSIDINLAKKFFTYSEYMYIKNIQLEKQSQEFIRIWTLKESYIKCIGRGLSIPLDSFEFENKNDKFQLKGKDNDAFQLEQMVLKEEYYITVCSYKEEIEKKINFINIEQFLL